MSVTKIFKSVKKALEYQVVLRNTQPVKNVKLHKIRSSWTISYEL